jgi:hypothetical protein
MISRRTFLRVAGVAAVPLGASLLAWHQTFAWAAGRSAAWLDAGLRSPESRLRAHFHYLDLDPAGVAQFFADLGRYRPDLSPRHRPLGPSVHNLFLLSTDFFRHGGDETRRVYYVGFYDPAITACDNPLARFDDEPAR